MGKYLTEADLAEIIRPASEAIPEGSYWTHVVGGGQYIVDCIAIAEGSQEPVVVYHAIGHAKQRGSASRETFWTGDLFDLSRQRICNAGNRHTRRRLVATRGGELPRT